MRRIAGFHHNIGLGIERVAQERAGILATNAAR